MRKLVRVALLGVIAAGTMAAVPPNESKPPTAQPAPAGRWVDATPDAAVDTAAARAMSGSERDALAAMAMLGALDDRAEYGRVKKSLEEIAKKAAAGAETRGEAALMARMLAADEGSDSGVTADRALGVATDLAVLGPFRDTGGGIDAKDGPEASPTTFGDPKQRYSWGSIEVAWRAVPRTYAQASGLPLDVFVTPRKESCTWVATKVTLPSAQTFVVRLAATGQARLLIDGALAGVTKDAHQSARFDRLAAKVDAAAGAHLVAAKVCSGALDDQGRVRVRFTDAQGAPLALATSADIGAFTPGAKPKITPEKTALERTIAHAEDAESQLDAAIVRTLAGADDLASPRAPGILAALVQGGKDGAKLNADHLAVAAWISPSQANRSAWLNAALARAQKDGDVRTQAFVERRIIVQHLDSRLVDWAMAARRAAHLDDAKDTEAIHIAARVDAALGTDAHSLVAMRALAAVVDRDPNAAPNTVLQDLAVLSGSFDATRALTIRDLIAKRGMTGAPWVEARSARGKAAVVEAARASFDGGLSDSDEAIAVAKAVWKAGALDVARDLYGKLVRWAPNRAEAWAGFADAIAATEPSGGDADAAVLAALRRARELAPGEARYRSELALRSKQTTQAGEPQGDEKYIVPSQTILARRQGVPASGPPEATDRTLHWVRAVIMHPDKRVSQMIHYAREILIAPRTTDELYEDIPAEGEQTEILRARVHRKNGAIAFPTEEHNEGSRPRIRWPELAPGDTVEVAIRTWTGGPVGGRGDPPFYFLDAAGGLSTSPNLYNEVVVEAPREHPIYVDVINGAADKREEKDENGRHVLRLVWDKPMNVPDEPLAPAISEIVPMTVGSTFKDWNEFRTWYGEAVRGFTEPDAEVKRMAAELTKGKTTRDEKLRAIFNFVADDIRYVNYVSGEWWLPNRPQQLLARREGDCDDKAMLLITLLRSVGIEAQEVMVQTRLTNKPAIVRAKGAAIPLFDHGIAFLPGPNGGMYLDATSPQSRLGPLPSMDARAVALRMDSGPAEIVQLPASSPDDHGADITWSITMQPDGSGELAAEEKHSGDAAFWLRTNLTEANARAQYVEDRIVYGWFPTVEVDKNVDFKGNLANGTAWVKYKAKSRGYARHEQQDMVVALSPAVTLASQIAPLVRRTLPVSLPSYLAPSHETRTIKVVAPKGFKWAALPSGGQENGGDFGRAKLDITKDPADPRVIVVKRSLVFDQSLIPVDKYGAWRAWIQRVDSLMHKSVRLVPEGGAR